MKKIIGIALVGLLMTLGTVSPASADTAPVRANVLESRCADDGGTIVRINIVSDGPHYVNYNSQWTNDSGGKGFDSGIEAVDGGWNLIRIHIPAGSTVHVNVWQGKTTDGALLLDYTTDALLC